MVEDEPKLISYTISVFTLDQMHLDLKKRSKPKSTCLQLKSDIAWDAFKAKLLSKIDNILKPKTISFQDYYVMTFSIARHPTPTSLDDEDSYKFMVSWAIDTKTNVSASVTVEPVVPEPKTKAWSMPSFLFLVYAASNYVLVIRRKGKLRWIRERYQ